MSDTSRLLPRFSPADLDAVGKIFFPHILPAHRRVLIERLISLYVAHRDTIYFGGERQAPRRHD